LKGGKFFNNKQFFYNFKLTDFLNKNIDGFKNNYINIANLNIGKDNLSL
jgi:hypothetical protein